MHLSEPAIDRFIPNQTRTNPPRIYISRPVTQVYFPPPLNFSESCRIRMLSRSRARVARAAAREFLTHHSPARQRLTREFASVAEGGFLKFWAVLEFRYRYSTGIPYDFELILILIVILILNCSTVVLNYTYVVEWPTVAFCYPGGQHIRIWTLDREIRIQR